MNPYEIDHDVLYPRDERHRYRIYAVTDAGMKVLTTTATPGGIGTTLVQLDDDARNDGASLNDEGRIGVLDVLGGGKAGRWIVLPFDRRR